MAIQDINVGLLANDGTGDDLREAFRIDPKDEVLAKKIKKITCIKRS